MNNIQNSSTVNYNYKIDPTQPVQSTSVDSNTTETELVIGELSMVKSVDKEYATIEDILTYTVVITNTGNILVTDVVFTDILPDGVTFEEGSVTVDGVSQPTYDPSVGFDLGSLIILGTKTVTFQAKVTSLPNPNTIINTSSTTYDYLVIIPVSGSSTSNSVTTYVNVTELSVVKTASAEIVTAGDTLTYTIVITNEGNIDATDIEFIDTIAPELTFVEGSVTIDGESQPTYDPNTGFSLGTLVPNGTITVTFETIVN